MGYIPPLPPINRERPWPPIAKFYGSDVLGSEEVISPPHTQMGFARINENGTHGYIDMSQASYTLSTQDNEIYGGLCAICGHLPAKNIRYDDKIPGNSTCMMGHIKDLRTSALNCTFLKPPFKHTTKPVKPVWPVGSKEPQLSEQTVQDWYADKGVEILDKLEIAHKYISKRIKKTTNYLSKLAKCFINNDWSYLDESKNTTEKEHPKEESKEGKQSKGRERSSNRNDQRIHETTNSQDD